MFTQHRSHFESLRRKTLIRQDIQLHKETNMVLGVSSLIQTKHYRPKLCSQLKICIKSSVVQACCSRATAFP